MSALDDVLPALEAELAALDDRRAKILAARDAIRLLLGAPLARTLADSVKRPAGGPALPSETRVSDQSVVRLLRAAGKQSLQQIARNITKATKPTTLRQLARIMDHGDIVREGAGRATRYRVKEGL